MAAWVDGTFEFENMSLGEITDQLGRWYDVDFVFADPVSYTHLVVLAAVGWLFWRLIRKTRFKERIHSFFKGLKEGLLSVKDVRHKGLFVFYSLFIWLMYFLMFYVCFFCFQFTSHLGALVGLTIFVLSSYGMVAPVQGGIGAWHFMRCV